MNDLKLFYNNNKNNNLNKWHHYFDIYEENFSKYRNKKNILIEIGIFKGGSLLMWEKYFGPQTLIIGIDINPDCKKFEKNNIKIYTGDQTDTKFLNSVIKDVGNPNIIIDDGGHTANQQITSFNFLIKQLANNGLYLIEDTHTSYNQNFQDRTDGLTFAEYAKNLSDELNGWYKKKDYKFYKKAVYEDINVSFFTKNIYKISFYNSIIVFEKKQNHTPRSQIK